jgi:GNAT superfamily N-acetyltransferase
MKKIAIRFAIREDLEAIEKLMKHSMRILGRGHYSQQQIESCCRYVCVPDLQLILDQTLFVAVSDQTIVGCGGWSFRKTLHAGPLKSSQDVAILNPEKDSARIRAMFVEPSESGMGIGSLILAHSERAAQEHGFQNGMLGATLSGLAFYQSRGWASVAQEPATLQDGVVIDVVRMGKVFKHLKSKSGI